MPLSPLPLRLCCLAAMAPALTSDCPANVRGKHPQAHSAGSSQWIAQTELQESVAPTLKFLGNSTNLPELQPKLPLDAESAPERVSSQSGVQTREILPRDELLGVSSKDLHSHVSDLEQIGMSRASLSSHAGEHVKGHLENNSTQVSSESSMVPPHNDVNGAKNRNKSPVFTYGVISSRSELPAVNSLTTSTSDMGITTRSPLPSLSQPPPLTNGVNSLEKSVPSVNHSTSATTLVTSHSKYSENTSLYVASHSTVVSSDLGLTSPSLRTESPMDAGRKQRQLECRAERLLKRLQRLQSRQAISHVKQQMCGFVENQQQTLLSSRYRKSSEFKAELLQSKDVKNLSTAALVNLVQKLQSNQPSSKSRVNCMSQERETETKVRLEEETCQDIERVTGHLRSNLQHLQNTIDSDVTESSSGGESCDEMEPYEEDWGSRTSKPSLRSRAEWQWSRDRAAIASRWTWLQAQVSDLEYRIRQQNDIYRQIHNNKGQVVLGSPPQPTKLFPNKTETSEDVTSQESSSVSADTPTEMSPANVSTLMCNVDKQTSHLNKHLGNFYSPKMHLSASSSCSSTPKTLSTPNGFLPPSQSSSQSSLASTPELPSTTQKDSFDPVSPANDCSCQAARCRPVRSYRKRKLLKTAGLYQLSCKAAKLSSVDCQCSPPVVPCVMCGGRLNNVTKLDCLSMTSQEKIALLDPSYHPVLSFPFDIPLSLHFESMLKSGDWQQKNPSKTLRLNAADKRKARYSKDRAKKYAKRLSKSSSAVMLSSAKIKNKYEQSQLSRCQSTASLPADPASPPHDTHKHKAIDSMRRRRSLHSPAPRSRSSSLSAAPIAHRPPSTSSPLPAASCTLREMKDALRRRRGDNAYDIDNIVIPYSIAAATRVEKLQYKEIVTPKWRKLPEGEHGSENSAHQADTTEDPQLADDSSQLTSTAASSKPAAGDPETDAAQLTNSNSQLPGDSEQCGNDKLKTEQLSGEISTLSGQISSSSGHISPSSGQISTSSGQISTLSDQINASQITTSDRAISPTVPCEASTSSQATPAGDSEVLEPKVTFSNDDQLTEDTEEVEDLSDESYRARHSVCELAERKRFSTLPSTTNRRGRANVHKSDSSVMLSVTEPMSPQINSESLVTAPVNAVIPGTFAASLEDINEDSSSRLEEGVTRKRTASVSSSRSDRCMSVFEDITPWPLRTFPLSEVDQVALQVPVSVEKRRVTVRLDTPLDTSPVLSDSVLDEPDDEMDDPEWTIISQQKLSAPKSSIVLKLAKR